MKYGRQQDLISLLYEAAVLLTVNSKTSTHLKVSNFSIEHTINVSL